MTDTFTSDTYDALCQEAEGYLARGLAEQARELLLKAASLIGTRPRARSLLADACMSLGLWDEARSQLENLTTLEVDNYHNHFRLGQVLEELSENQLARDNYNVVLDHSPDHHGAKVALNRIDSSDDTTDVNLASFFSAGSGSTDSVPEAPLEDTDSGNVVESVFGSTQVFPDAQTDDVFAGEEDIEQGVDKLLKDLGVDGDTQETSGAVSELLSSLGITPDGDENEGEKVVEKVDISSILETDASSGVKDKGKGEEAASTDAEPAPETAALTDASQDEADVLESAFASGPELSSTDAEPEPAAPSQIEPGIDTETAVLESVFSTAGEEPLPEAPEEVPPTEEQPPADDKKEVGMLESIFGATVEERAPEPAVEEPPIPEPVTEEPPIPEPVTEEPPIPEPVTEEPPIPEPAVEEPAPEPVAEEPPAPAVEERALEPAAEKPPAPEPAAEEPPAPAVEERALEPAAEKPPAPEPAAEKPPAPEPAAEKPPAVEAPEEAAASVTHAAAEPAVYTIHKPDFESLVVVELKKGTLAVRQAYIAAMDSRLNLEADEGKRLLSGSGSIWLGQGDRTPVIIAIEQGMYVRSDRMVLFDSCVLESPAGIPDIPALVRLEAPEGSEILCFAGGRIREVSLPGNRATLTVRSSSLLAAGKDIELTKSDSSDFLTLSGCGRIYISG